MGLRASKIVRKGPKAADNSCSTTGVSEDGSSSSDTFCLQIVVIHCQFRWNFTAKLVLIITQIYHMLAVNEAPQEVCATVPAQLSVVAHPGKSTRFGMNTENVSPTAHVRSEFSPQSTANVKNLSLCSVGFF